MKTLFTVIASVVRLIVIIPLILICLSYCPFLWLLGTDKPVDKMIKLWEAVTFNIN